MECNSFCKTKTNSAMKDHFRKIIIIDNFCIVLFCGVHKLTALYNKRDRQADRDIIVHTKHIQAVVLCYSG